MALQSHNNRAAIAALSLRNCKVIFFAIALQSFCSRNAVALQSHCNRAAIAALSLRNRI
jgi:hypothetical protein